MTVEYQYVYGNYMATGEGSTTMLMITRAYPRSDDYEIPAKFELKDGMWVFDPGVLKYTPTERALREFRERFGDWFGRCGEVVSKEEFFQLGRELIPPFVHEMIESDDPPGNFKWEVMCHCNFS